MPGDERRRLAAARERGLSLRCPKVEIVGAAMPTLRRAGPGA